MKFNENLINLRKQNGLSQEELGAKLNTSRQTISKWELGETTPEMDKLIQLSEIFNITIDELIGKEKTDVNQKQNYYDPRLKMHYEYKSKKTIKGIPLVHINFGFGLYRAKGIIAIGNLATGIISLGLITVGLLSFGAISLGLLLACGAIAAGLLSFGGLALGGLAIGGIAIGYYAIGGLAVGIYSLGGCAIAKRVALGGYANAHIAIGDAAGGDFIWEHISKIPKETYKTIREVIIREYPNIPKFILNFFAK